MGEIEHYIDDAAHEIHMRWQGGEQGDDESPTPLPDDLVRETAEAIVRLLHDDLREAVEALERSREALDRAYSPQLGRCVCDLHPVDVFDQAIANTGGR